MVVTGMAGTPEVLYPAGSWCTEASPVDIGALSQTS